ncbi:MAG: regulatory protein RecX [Patescibacteria group bacterium]
MASRPLPPLQYALYLLRNRARSKRDMLVKLRDKGYENNEVVATVEKLEKIGLLDDQKYAQNYTHDKIRIYRRGRHRIFLELLQKGVPKDLINEAIGGIEQDQELEAARSLLESKERQWRDLTERKRYEKSVHLLQRRGFPGAVIREVLKKD